MRAAIFGLGILLLAHLAFSQEKDKTPVSSVGKKIDGFTLKDTAGKPVSLAGFKDKKAVVVVFVGTECPLNNAFLPRLADLHKEFEAQAVQFLAINANQHDTAERIAEHARQTNLPFPVLKDDGNAVADQFGARRTPEAFVLDGERVIRYQGRIDDQFGIGYKKPKPTRRDLAVAVEELLAGKAVSQATTPVQGCLIARAVKPKSDGQVTYAKHVAAILQNRCLECHRPGQIGPMSLLRYEDVVSWSASIREAVEERRMPPWHADPKHGKFQNDRSLSKEDRDTLLTWIDHGCPKGDDKDLPAKKEWASDWTIGKPDVVYTMTREFRVPAEAKNGVRYQYSVVQTNFDEDRWIQAAEARPGNRAVVHHIIVYIRGPNTAKKAIDGIGDGFLVGQAPGDLPTILPPGTAKRLPKGASVVFQMHYTPNGTEQTDRSMVGLIFAKEPPKQVARTRGIAQQLFLIPPNADSHKVTSRTTFPNDTLLLSLLPHMHLRGKSFEYQAVYPDGKTEVLLSVPHYDFNWQSNYRLEKPLKLPAGTRIECTAHFNNSASNLSNPDPTKWIRWGDQTWEEMMIGFVDYVDLTEVPK